MKNYFSAIEQSCRCCGTGKLAPDFLFKLNAAREIAGIPFVLNSAFRCPKHNKEVGGTENSAHLVGCAADIRILNNWERYVILKALFDHEVKLHRIGIGRDFIHVDDDFTKPSQVCYLY